MWIKVGKLENVLLKVRWKDAQYNFTEVFPPKWQENQLEIGYGNASRRGKLGYEINYEKFMELNEKRN